MFHVKHRGHTQRASAYRDRLNPIRTRMKSRRISCFTWNICVVGRHEFGLTAAHTTQHTAQAPSQSGTPRRLVPLYRSLNGAHQECSRMNHAP